MPLLLFRRLLAGAEIEVPLEGENWCHPIHTDDIVRQTHLLWQAATVPARVVNWAGDDRVSIRELLTYLAELAGVPARFRPSAVTRDTHAFDNTLREQLIGRCTVDWRAGMQRLLADHFPDPVPAPGPH
jgi:nucleoside-diphosphate-sugar epimerase